MSTIENGGSTVPAMSYADAAQKRLQELLHWREQIPHFAIPPASNATQRLSAAASVPAEFVELTNVAIANHTTLVRADGATPPEVRDLMAYADAYSPIADELEVLAKFVRYSVTAARNKAANEALTTYSLAQRLAKQPENATLVPYVADMRRALGRVRKPTPEALAEKAAGRAAKAAAKAAKQAPKALLPVTTTEEPS